MEGAVSRIGARAGDHIPVGAVPVLYQHLFRAGAVVAAHGPDVIGRYRRYPIEGVDLRAGVGAGDETPSVAVPVLYQRPFRDRAVVGADGPDVIGRQSSYPIEVITASIDV